MKKITVILIALFTLFLISSCSGVDEIATTTRDPSPASTEKHIDETDIATEQNEERNLSPAELLDYIVGEDGIYLDRKKWTELEDYSLFRTYFFGKWENADAIPGWESLMIFDDSERSFFQENQRYRFLGFYEIGTDALAFSISDSVDNQLFWLDKNDPDNLYGVGLSAYPDELLIFYGRDSAEEIKPIVFTKTDILPNEPEENFLSIFKLHEISRDYGIDFELLVDLQYVTDIEYEGKEFTTRLVHDDWCQFYPVYLVSEAPEKLELKTQIGNGFYENSEIGVSYTLEKINGEWVRTLEFDDAAKLQ